MPTLSHDCPHCGIRNNAFLGVKSVPNLAKKYYWTTLFICPSCGGGVVVEISDGGTGIDPMSQPADIRAPLHTNPSFRFGIINIHPKPIATEIPSHLPERVGKTFKEGCEILQQSPTGACSLFRKTLEIALKDLSPEIEAWKLEKRIDKMADQHLITPSIQEWAHQLRLDGNEALHESEDPTIDDARQMESLTRFVLMYIYTLPGQIAEARNPAE